MNPPLPLPSLLIVAKFEFEIVMKPLVSAVLITNRSGNQSSVADTLIESVSL